LADFKNPQQEPGAEKRLLLVFLLTFVVLIIFQPLLKKYLPQAPASPQKQSAPEPSKAVAPPSAAIAAVTPANLPQSTTSKQASSETETVVENDLYKIIFTNHAPR